MGSQGQASQAKAFQGFGHSHTVSEFEFEECPIEIKGHVHRFFDILKLPFQASLIENEFDLHCIDAWIVKRRFLIW